MACTYSIAWLVYLIILVERFRDFGFASTQSHDLKLLLSYRRLSDKRIANGSCDHDYNLLGSLVKFHWDYRPWDNEVNLTIKLANFLTSMWRYKDADNFSLIENKPTLYSLARLNALSSHSIYGSVICFDSHRFRGLERFCPYAYKEKSDVGNGSLTRVFDLAIDYDNLTESNNKTKFIWWNIGRTKAVHNKLKKVVQYNDINLSEQVHHGNASDVLKSHGYFNTTVSLVARDDGIWTTPYYDCFGSKIWMFTYLAPFYNETGQFLGLVSFHVDLDTIEVNQCEPPAGIKDAPFAHKKEVTLYKSHLCKKKSTECVHLPGGGFNEGSYRCVCRKGFYFPDPRATEKYFVGMEIIKTYNDDKKQGTSLYNSKFYCLPCREGCHECVDDTPCMYHRNMRLRIVFLSLNEVSKALAVALGIFIFVFRKRKIIKASSPVFMGIIAFGIFLMYFEISFGYLEPSVALCIARSWLYHTGFILAFGSLLLKTWRVSIIFRLRSAKMVLLTDMSLLKYLSVMVASVLLYLMIWTWTSTQAIEIHKTGADLKYRRCVRGWFSNAIEIGEILFLAWGVWLCFQVRKAPSAYNECTYIAWCIYNTVFIMGLVGLLRFLLGNFDNPDVRYVVDFLSTHVVATVLLLLLFVSKIYLLRKYSKHVAKNIHGAAVSTSATDLPKSPFHLNRLVDGSLAVQDMDEDRSMGTTEMENVALREEIRSLNARLAVYENKQDRENRKKESEVEVDESDKRPKDGEQNDVSDKDLVHSNDDAIACDKSKRSWPIDGSTTSNGSVFTREGKSGSLLEDIKNAGEIDDFLAVPLRKSLSDEALTVISTISADSQQ